MTANIFHHGDAKVRQCNIITPECYDIKIDTKSNVDIPAPQRESPDNSLNDSRMTERDSIGITANSH
jgi:hypothetical protein